MTKIFENVYLYKGETILNPAQVYTSSVFFMELRSKNIIDRQPFNFRNSGFKQGKIIYLFSNTNIFTKKKFTKMAHQNNYSCLRKPNYIFFLVAK